MQDYVCHISSKTDKTKLMATMIYFYPTDSRTRTHVKHVSKLIPHI